MKKIWGTMFISTILIFVCIVSSCPMLDVLAQGKKEEFSEVCVVLEEDVTEPSGGVEADEVTLISEEEAEEIHEAFLKREEMACYSVLSVNSSFASNYGYSMLATLEEKSCYAEIKTKAYQFHQQYSEPILRQSTTSYYIWDEFLVSEYGLTEEQVRKILFALEADCPELFWFSRNFGYAYNTETKLVTQLYPKIQVDYISAEVRKETQTNIEAGMQPYLKAIDQAKAQGADEMELELLIHDMILEAVDYEYDPETGKPQSATYAHSIVGLFEHTGVVCEGYAKGFHLLMTYAGIDTIYAVGYGDGEGHAWNLVCMDGNWYNIDLTWNDAGNKGTYHDGIRYRYYNCSSDFFGNHVYMPSVFVGMYEVPETNADVHNYYHYYDLYVTAEAVSGETNFVNFMTNAIKKAENREDYLLQFAFEALDTRNRFKECVAEYKDEMLAAVSDKQNIYKMTGSTFYISGSPYNVYFPMVRIYADTYEVEENGAEAELTFHIIKGRREVAKGENYQINYYDNESVGEAKAIVIGLGTYEFLGENEFTFYITKKPTVTATPEPTKEVLPLVNKVSGLKLVSANSNTVRVVFEKESSVTGYEVVLYQGNKEKKRIDTTQNNCKLKNLSTATDYKVKVRAYIKIGNEVIYSKYSNTLSVGTATKSPVIRKIKSGKKQAVIYWEKVKKASGYEVYMSGKKSSGYKKVATIKKSSAVKYTKKKLKMGKKYYFKVRTYRTINGKKVYSSYSKAKSTKL